LTIIKSTTFEFGRETGYQTDMQRLSGYISFRRKTVNKAVYNDRGPQNKYTRRHCAGEREIVSSSRKT